MEVYRWWLWSRDRGRDGEDEAGESTHWLLTVRGAKKSDLRQTLGTARGETFREIGELHVQSTGVIIVIITERMHVSLYNLVEIPSAHTELRL